MVNPEELKTSRAGVIPYVIINNSIYFLLGVDNRTKELTDFGGGVKASENSIEGAIREFREETNSIFGKKMYSEGAFSDCITVSDCVKMTILFKKIDKKWIANASRKFYFRTKYTQGLRYQEIDKLLWIHEMDFRTMVRHNNLNFILWEKIRRFLKMYNNNSFYDILRTM